MKLYLAGTTTIEKEEKEIYKAEYILESYYSIKPMVTSGRIKNINKDKFLLDSGAFTFMNSKKGEINFDEYLTNYINFINEYDIKYFFELDIDNVIGYKKVKEMRNRLEKETNKKCIPVWHKSRGLEEYKKLCKEYNYIAIGGIVTKEIKKKDYKYFYPLLKIAKDNNCKVHGLGFTNIEQLKKYKFYSVDSTTWLSGGRFGQLHIFQDNTIKTISNKTMHGKYKELNHKNFMEWIKFQKYVDKYL